MPIGPTSANFRKLACRCGAVQGTLDLNAPSQRLVCYCTDCQAFSDWLDPELLDAAGGTPLTQVPPGSLTLDHGHEQIQAVRLTPTGMIRWYASCCKTPIGNTPASGSPPFIGVIERFVVDADVPPTLRCHCGEARTPVEGSKFPLTLLLGGMRIAWSGWWRSAPHPLFPDGRPLAEPTVLN